MGLPAWDFLTTSDDETKVLLSAVAQKALEVRQVLDHNLANLVIYEIAKATRRG